MLVFLGPKRFWTHRRVMADSTLDPQLSTLDRGFDATFGCGGAALCSLETGVLLVIPT
jgi:hypothetical protein